MVRKGAISMRRLLILLAMALASAPAAYAQFGFCGVPFSPPVPPPTPPPDCECGCKGSPCYVGSGAFGSSSVDLIIPTPGLDLTVARSYDSTRAIDGPLGKGWTVNLSAHLFHTTYLLAAPSTVLKQVDVTMPDGRRVTFSQAADGTFVAPLERHDSLIWNVDGSWDLTIFPDSAVYHFRSDGSLERIRDEFGNSLVYIYETTGRLQRVEDVSGSGRYLDIFWGADGRLSALRDHTARQVAYTYTAQGALDTVSDPLGRSTHYSYVQGRFSPLLSSERDNWNRLVTTVAYDSRDRVRSYSDEGEEWAYTYDYQGNALKTAKTDSSGNTWIFTYLPSGLITGIQQPANAGGGVSHTDYNSDGSVRLTTDEVGVKTHFDYNSNGTIRSITYDYQGPKAVRFDYGYHPVFTTKAVSITPKNPSTGANDANWQGWHFEYYDAGNPAPGALRSVARIEADGLSLDVVASYTYDARGLITSFAGAGDGVTDLTYDSLGNLRVVLGAANNDLGLRPMRRYDYDALGRVISFIDPGGGESSYTYDDVGRLVSSTLPPAAPGSDLNRITTRSYDAYDADNDLVVQTTIDVNGNATRRGYDQHLRLVTQIDALNAVTVYTYTRNRLTGIEDPNGLETTLAYDAAGRLLQATRTGASPEIYSYYADGELRTRTNRNGGSVTHSYDHLKRLIESTYSDERTLSYFFMGQRLSQVTDTILPGEVHSFAYDDLFRLTGVTQASRGTITYSYAEGDRPTGYQVAGGSQVSYSYYSDGSLRTIDWNRATGSFRYTYNARGQYERLDFPNGQHRDFSYDGQGRLTRLANVHPVTGVLAAWDYGFDVDLATNLPTLIGQLTSVTAEIPAASLNAARTAYRYDGVYRLVEASYPSVASSPGRSDAWTYDVIGNRVASRMGTTIHSYTYAPAVESGVNSQLLLGDGSSTYSYDDNGNILSRATQQGQVLFGWDLEDRLRSITGPAGQTVYSYDFDGRRTSRAAAEGVTTSLYDLANLIQENGDGGRVEYLLGPGVDQLLAVWEEGSDTRFIATDALGSPVVSSNAAGVAQDFAIFDAWGQLLASSGSPVAGSYSYSGREWAAEGLLFYRNRYYYPVVGRFLSEDPLGPSDGPSLYAYVGSSPTQYTDPLGLLRVKCEGCRSLADAIRNVKRRIELLRTTGTAIDPNPPPGRGNVVAASTECYSYVFPNGRMISYARTIRNPDDSPAVATFSQKPCQFLCAGAHERIHRQQCGRAGIIGYAELASVEVRFELPAYEEELKCLRSARDHGHLDVDFSGVHY